MSLQKKGFLDHKNLVKILKEYILYEIEHEKTQYIHLSPIKVQKFAKIEFNAVERTFISQLIKQIVKLAEKEVEIHQFEKKSGRKLRKVFLIPKNATIIQKLKNAEVEEILDMLSS